MKCLKCGAEINDSAKFCPFCGAEQRPAPAAPEEKNTESAEKKEETAASSADATVSEQEEKIQEEPQAKKTDEEMASSANASASGPEKTEAADQPDPDGSSDCASKSTQQSVREKLSSFRQLSIYLSDPTAETRLDLIPAAVIVAVSCIANSWLVYSMLSAVIRTLLEPVVQMFGQTMNVPKVMEELGYGFGSFLSGGLTATVLILIFMLIVTFLGSTDRKNIFGIICKAAGNMAIPTLMILLAAVCFQKSIYIGLVLVIAALSSYIVVITSRMPKKMNVYVKILLVTLFILLLCFCFSNALSLNTLFLRR